MMVKLDLYRCDRCGEAIEIETGLKPITLTHIDARFSNEEMEEKHLCDDCYSVFLISMSQKKKIRKAFDVLTEKFAGEECE